jgi:MFS family permease
MLCESKKRIGFLGACFFVGVLIASTIMPMGLLSDMFGRKWIFVGTLGILIVACLGFMFAHSLEELYVYMFLLGITFPGRMIVGINFAQEFQKESWIPYVQPLVQVAQGLTLVLTAFYFQVISKHAYYLEMAHVIFLAYMMFQTLWSFPESPRFNYSKNKFLEAKENLQQVANINGVRHFNPGNFKFDNEVQHELHA